jgi:hypothetical protein
MTTYGEIGSVASSVLNRYQLEVSAAQRKNPRCPMGRRLGCPHGEEKNPCLCLESNVGSSARNLVTILTEL